MSYELGLRSFTVDAASDLSADQFLFVKVGSGGTIALASTGDPADGVLQNKPTSGASATVAYSGISKVVVGAGGTVTRGDLVASDSAGAAVTAGSGNYVIGRALETGAPGAIIAVLLGTGKGKV